jgi:hypothetical protein
VAINHPIAPDITLKNRVGDDPLIGLFLCGEFVPDLRFNLACLRMMPLPVQWAGSGSHRPRELQLDPIRQGIVGLRDLTETCAKVVGPAR